MKGVTDSELKIIQDIIKPFQDKYTFYAYGSRVKGNFRPVSDLDLMIKGSSEASLNDLERLKEDFDNSSLSFIVNIVDFYNLEKSFYNIIKRDLKII